MNILAINTSQKVGQVSLKIDKKVLNSFLSQTKSFSENILVSVDSLLKNNNILISDIDAIGVVCGPGSFTGTRIAISLIKGFVSALKDIKIVALNVFDVLAECVGKKDCVLIESSGVGDYYYALVKNGEVKKIDVGDLDNIKKMNIEIAENVIQKESALIDAMEKKIQNKQFCKIENLEPLYIKLSQAQKELKNKIGQELHIVEMKDTDIDKVMDIEKECFTTLRYEKEMFKSDLLDKSKKYYVAKINDVLIGFLGMSICDFEAEILKIAVKKNYSQLGVGTELIKYFINNISAVKKIYLEVEEDNYSAIKFYESLNFIKCGERKKYYSQCKNALLMELSLF